MDDDQREPRPRLRSSSSIRIRSPYSYCSQIKRNITTATHPDSTISPKKPDAKKSGVFPAFLGRKVLNANKVAASTIGPKTLPSKKLSAASPVVEAKSTPHANKLSAASPVVGAKSTPHAKKLSAASPVVGAKSTPYSKKSAASPGFLGRKVPNANKVAPALSPPSTSSNSSKETQGRPKKENVTPSLRSLSIQRSLLFKYKQDTVLISDKQDTVLISDSTADQNSPEATLLKHLEELSNMKSSLEMTSALVQELFSCSDSKYTEAWKEADRGVKRLEEGLRIITEAQKLLRSPTNITIPEEELH